MSGKDPLLDLLRDADAAVRAGAKAHVDGDLVEAVAELVDARIEISDVIADLRSEADDPEPRP